MRLIGLSIAAAALWVTGAVAEEQSGQGQAASGGVFDWIVNTISGSQPASPTTDANNTEKKDTDKNGQEPGPIGVPDDGVSDQDSYKPDAGDAPK
jgi:hypothetical protein